MKIKHMDAYFKLVSIFTLIVVMLIFGMLFYQHDMTLTIVIIAAGILLVLVAIASEIYTKRGVSFFLPQKS